MSGRFLKVFGSALCKYIISEPFVQTPIDAPSALQYDFNCSRPSVLFGFFSSTIT
jgi:hypothetical protein